MKKIYWFIILITILLAGCELEQLPQDSASRVSVFGSEKGLELYANSFYNMLPSGSGVHRTDCITDYTARRDAPAFLREGSYTPTSTDITNESGYSSVAFGGDSNWGWTSLRNINYFIENCRNYQLTANIPADVRNHYLGLARFFEHGFILRK